MPKISQLTRYIRALKVLAGFEKRFLREKTFKIAGQVHTRRSLVALYQAQIDAIDRIRTTHAAWSAAVAAERPIARRTDALTAHLKLRLRNELGPDRVAFADFGWELPKKRGPKTLAGKVAGAEKARATRAARRG